MRAVVVRAHGGPEVLEVDVVDDPSPGPLDAIVRVRAVALNHLDLWIRKGLPGAPFHLPAITGADVAGDVVAYGSAITRPPVPVGAPVMVCPNLSCGVCRMCVSGLDHLCPDYGILGEHAQGGMAELVRVPAASLVPKPQRFTYEEAASVSLTFLTAWHMLVARAEVRPGELVLVHAAGSGVGVAAIQIARFLGARVIATASRDDKREAALSLGADHALDGRDDGWPKKVKELSGGRGVDVVFEHVGGETFERSLRVLARAGRVVTCGATAGIDVKLNLRHLFFKALSILGSTMGTRGEYHQLAALYEGGHFRPIVDRVLPLAEVREAHRALEAREVFGKVVLVP
ncbi:MAG: zinc-binding dehydrogenase [Deltaproteobacteria bacterium]|nr:zinc-binding dehydrogenase [Deltaproteobacteria bacterium]